MDRVLLSYKTMLFVGGFVLGCALFYFTPAEKAKPIIKIDTLNKTLTIGE